MTKVEVSRISGTVMGMGALIASALASYFPDDENVAATGPAYFIHNVQSSNSAITWAEVERAPTLADFRSLAVSIAVSRATGRRTCR
jgi:hypothetical protein